MGLSVSVGVGKTSNRGLHQLKYRQARLKTAVLRKNLWNDTYLGSRCGPCRKAYLWIITPTTSVLRRPDTLSFSPICVGRTQIKQQDKHAGTPHRPTRLKVVVKTASTIFLAAAFLGGISCRHLRQHALTAGLNNASSSIISKTHDAVTTGPARDAISSPPRNVVTTVPDGEAVSTNDDDFTAGPDENASSTSHDDFATGPGDGNEFSSHDDFTTGPVEGYVFSSLDEFTTGPDVDVAVTSEDDTTTEPEGRVASMSSQDEFTTGPDEGVMATPRDGFTSGPEGDVVYTFGDDFTAGPEEDEGLEAWGFKDHVAGKNNKHCNAGLDDSCLQPVQEVSGRSPIPALVVAGCTLKQTPFEQVVLRSQRSN